MNAIEMSNITFAYKKCKYVLEDLNLSVEGGEIHGILGHNGAGKTTILRLITGLITPQTGMVTLYENQPHTTAKDIISYMPESIGIYEKLNATQNMEFRGLAEGLSQQETKLRTEELLTQLGLKGRQKEQAGYLSNGLKKRLSLSCALIKKPKLLLLDEPTNGIDPASLKIIIDLLKTLNKEGTTILISSHDLLTVSRLCTSLTIIQNGRDIYKQQSSPIEPQNLESIYLEKTNEDREEAEL